MHLAELEWQFVARGAKALMARRWLKCRTIPHRIVESFGSARQAIKAFAERQIISQITFPHIGLVPLGDPVGVLPVLRALGIVTPDVREVAHTFLVGGMLGNRIAVVDVEPVSVASLHFRHECNEHTAAARLRVAKCFNVVAGGKDLEIGRDGGFRYTTKRWLWILLALVGIFGLSTFLRSEDGRNPAFKKDSPWLSGSPSLR